MQKKVSVGVFTVCILLAILLSVMTAFVLTRESFVTRARTSDNSAENLAAKLTELDGRFNQHYIGETDYETAEKYVMSAYLAGTGDKYAAYYTAEEYKEMMSASYGDSEGIGVSVIYNSEYGVIQIVEIFPDSPALAAGLEIGDLIAYIGIGENRESVAEIGYDAALTKLRGVAGTTAEFTVVRGENYETEVEFSIERGHYSEQTVLSRLYSKDTSVGVIRISQFEGVTPEQFKNAVSELTAEGAKKLIVDLRNNPGGDRDSICQVLDCILPEGPLLRVKQSDGEIGRILHRYPDRGSGKRKHRKRGGAVHLGDARLRPRKDRRYDNLRQGMHADLLSAFRRKRIQGHDRDVLSAVLRQLRRSRHRPRPRGRA